MLMVICLKAEGALLMHYPQAPVLLGDGEGGGRQGRRFDGEIVHLIGRAARGGTIVLLQYCHSSKRLYAVKTRSA